MKPKFTIRSFFIVCCISFCFQGKTQEDADTIISPAIEDLHKKIKLGLPQAVEDFWLGVSKNGSPLVERIPDDPYYRYVTFLYKGSPDTLKNVLIKFWNRQFLSHSYFLSSGKFINLSPTSVWYKTFKLRKDARFSYQFSPNDNLQPLTTFDQAVVNARLNNFIPDPLNTKHYKSLDGEGSILELDGASPQPWIKKADSIRGGKVFKEEFKSKILNNKRSIWVYLPRDYDRKKYYPLITMFDGNENGNAGEIPIPVILDNIINNKLIPHAVAVLIGNVEGQRVKELINNPNFAKFIATELIPYIREKYHTSKDPTHNVISGSSAGANAAIFVGFSYPKIFGNIISQSAGLMYPQTFKPLIVEKGQLLEYNFPENEWITKQFILNKKLSLRFHIDVGLLEDISWELKAPRFAYPSLLLANRHFRDVLLAKGYTVYYNEYNGGHEGLNWQGYISDGLIHLLGNKTIKEN